MLYVIICIIFCVQIDSCVVLFHSIHFNVSSGLSMSKCNKSLPQGSIKSGPVSVIWSTCVTALWFLFVPPFSQLTDPFRPILRVSVSVKAIHKQRTHTNTQTNINTDTHLTKTHTYLWLQLHTSGGLAIKVNSALIWISYVLGGRTLSSLSHQEQQQQSPFYLRTECSVLSRLQTIPNLAQTLYKCVQWYLPDFITRLWEF